MSINRHQMPGDGWVDLRAVADVSERLRRPIRAIQMRLAANPAFEGVIQAAQKKGVESLDDISEAEAVKMVTQMGDAADLMDELNDRLIISRVAGWSYGDDVTMDALQDLPGPVYDKLKEMCAEGALTNGPDFSPSQDPASPTEPSTA
ncbi:hypothetical protein ACWCP6_18080 [Streptomyces sp. NPDC002004]